MSFERLSITYLSSGLHVSEFAADLHHAYLLCAEERSGHELSGA